MKGIALAAACAVAVSASGARAQRAHTPPGRTTASGIFTLAQAARGKNVYLGMCRSCHTVESHTGATFAKWWNGKQLSVLFSWISTQMPKNDPGSLAPDDVADVTAYILKMNTFPAGKAELPPDSAALSTIRIVTPTKRTQ